MYNTLIWVGCNRLFANPRQSLLHPIVLARNSTLPCFDFWILSQLRLSSTRCYTLSFSPEIQLYHAFAGRLLDDSIPTSSVLCCDKPFYIQFLNWIGTF
jgi:hypothetical protein